MNILTRYGYKDALLVEVGEEVIAYNESGVEYNIVEDKRAITKEFYTQIEAPFSWFLINGSYKMFRDQSIWCERISVLHISELIIGDIIYDDFNNPLTVDTIEELVDCNDDWIRFRITGDHSFIADGLSLHNASRYWRGTTTVNWNNNNNWASTSGGTPPVSFPTVSDDVFLDHLGNNNLTVNAVSACLSLTIETGSGGYTANMTYTNTLTVSGNVTLGSNMTITNAGGQLIVNTASNLTSNGKIFTASMSMSTSSITYTLVDDWYITGTATLTGGSTINGNNLHLRGGFPVAGSTCQGTTNFIIDGTGSQTWTGGTIKNNIEINKASGTLTLAASVSYSTGIFKYTAGTVDTTTNNTNLAFTASCTITLNSALTLYKASFGGITGTTYTINGTNQLLLSNTIAINSNCTFDGTIGWGTPTLNISAANYTMTLQHGVTYSVTSTFTAVGTSAQHIIIKSETGGSQAIFTVYNGVVCDATYVNATDIDSSLGKTINTFKGTLSNATNWRVLSNTDIPTFSSSFLN